MITETDSAEVATAFPPGVEAILHAIVANKRCDATVDELSEAMGLSEAEVERRLIIGLDTGYIEIWANAPGVDGDSVTLTPLAAYLLEVEPNRYEEADEYFWAHLGNFATRQESINPWAHDPATPSDDDEWDYVAAIPSREVNPLDALAFAEEASIASELLESEIAAAPILESPVARMLQVNLFERRRFSLAGLPYIFIGDGKSWPVEPAKSGECGCCGGATPRKGRICIHCDDSGKNPVRPVKLPEWSGRPYSPEAKERFGKAGMRHSRGRRT